VLRELRVENYAVIDNVSVEFGAGLNLLTGETGAGKSILIDALALLLGEKAYSDAVRHGAEKATVSAVYQCTDAALVRVLDEYGIDAAGGEIILRREIAVNGKGRVFVNNQPATVAVLKALASHLAVVHAQNQAILMFDPPERLALLDAAAGVDSRRMAESYAKWREIQQRIAGLERDEQEKLRLADLWRFQLQEIGEADPVAGEDAKLEAEKRVLANAERVYAAAMGAFDVLYEVEDSALARLRAATRHLDELARFDESFQDSLGQLESARIAVEDVAATLRDFANGMDASPERLAEVEERLAMLDKLRRKYGKTIDDVLAYRQEIVGKLNEIEHKDELLAALRKELGTAAARYLDEARALSKRRREMAKILKKTVEGEINDLAMKAKFKIEVSGADGELERERLRPGGLPDLDQSRRADGPDRADRLWRRTLARDAGAEGQRRGAADTLRGGGQRALDGLRRDRHRHRRARSRCGGQEAEGALAQQAGAVHHAPAANRILCRPAFFDRKTRERRAHQNHRPAADGRRAAQRNRAHVERGGSHRSQPSQRGTTAEGQCVIKAREDEKDDVHPDRESVRSAAADQLGSSGLRGAKPAKICSIFTIRAATHA
jgi:DNA repair protein RecN (Recombination protein N)